MQGRICKHNNRWTVMYAPLVGSGVERWPVQLPLHPDDIKDIDELRALFDNIDARIYNSPNVEFEVTDISGSLVAKLQYNN